ncbi:hypothetical protein Hamer_G020238 [Homarus americanus]|uniref:Uncharacterized protein n=1 Tax=Homarus americanus TaxID=6706 RepID=A0A8J5J7J0_HOMAM|nr:hypothetical protein Hamer_G020238 [Homarus americanus]
MNIEATVIQHQFRWFEHVIQIPEERLLRKFLYSQLHESQRFAGGPKKRYKDQMKKALKKCNMTPSNLVNLCVYCVNNVKGESVCGCASAPNPDYTRAVMRAGVGLALGLLMVAGVVYTLKQTHEAANAQMRRTLNMGTLHLPQLTQKRKVSSSSLSILTDWCRPSLPPVPLESAVEDLAVEASAVEAMAVEASAVEAMAVEASAVVEEALGVVEEALGVVEEALAVVEEATAEIVVEAIANTGVGRQVTSSTAVRDPAKVAAVGLEPTQEGVHRSGPRVHRPVPSVALNLAATTVPVHIRTSAASTPACNSTSVKLPNVIKGYFCYPLYVPTATTVSTSARNHTTASRPNRSVLQVHLLPYTY